MAPRPMNTANPITIRRGAESLRNIVRKAEVLLGLPALLLGSVLHVADSNTLVSAGTLDLGKVYFKLVGFASCGVGSADPAARLLHVLHQHATLQAGAFDLREIHVQLVSPALSRLSGLYLVTVRGTACPVVLGVSPLSLLLPRASIQGVFGLLDDRGECGRLGGGEIREYLAVKVYLGESEAVDELRVR